MNPVSEAFLLTTAQIAATLIGLLLVGVLFFVETGLRRLERAERHVAPYLRAGAAFVLLLYSLVLAVSLALVVLEPAWVAGVFAVLSLVTVVALVAFTRQARDLARARPDVLHPVSAWLPWPPTLVALALPWLLGGATPAAAAFVPMLLLAGALAFLATAGLVLLTFDLHSFGRNEDGRG